MKKPYKTYSSGSGRGAGRGGFGGGTSHRGGRGGSSDWGDRRGSRDHGGTHQATCAACHVPCEVPFKPNGRKPIYCDSCFRKEQGGSGPGVSRRGAGRFERPAREYDRRPPSKAFDDLPQAPRAMRTGPNDEIAKQLAMLNEKMDQIINALMDLGDESVGMDDIEV